MSGARHRRSQPEAQIQRTVFQQLRLRPAAEGKITSQGTTLCGMPIPGVNNAKAVERYEKTTGTSVARPDSWTPREDREPDDLSIPTYLPREPSP